MIVTQISIDLSGKNRYEYVIAKQGDAESRMIQVRLLSDSRIYVIDDQTTARVLITKPDKKEVVRDCEVNNNMVEVVLGANMLAVAGTAEAEILLTDSAGTVTSASFDIKIVATNTGKNVESSNDYKSFKNALAGMQDIENQFKQLSIEVKGSIKDVGQNYELLWENEKPDEAFAGTTIQLGKEEMAKYSEFMITYKDNPNIRDSDYFYIKNVHEYEGEPITGTPGGYSYEMQSLSLTGLPSFRIVEVRGSYIRFEDCKRYRNEELENNNTALVPCKIYGVNRYICTDVDPDALVVAAVEDLFIPMKLTEYNALVEAGTVDNRKYYMIKGV